MFINLFHLTHFKLFADSYACMYMHRLYAYFTNKQALLLFTRVHFLSKCTEFPPLITQTDPLRMR